MLLTFILVIHHISQNKVLWMNEKNSIYFYLFSTNICTYLFRCLYAISLFHNRTFFFLAIIRLYSGKNCMRFMFKLMRQMRHDDMHIKYHIIMWCMLHLWMCIVFLSGLIPMLEKSMQAAMLVLFILLTYVIKKYAHEEEMR